MIIVAVIRNSRDSWFCRNIRLFFGWYFFLCLLQEPADIADFLHTVYRKSHAVLESDVTHGNVAADFPDALNKITAVVNHKLFAYKVRIILNILIRNGFSDFFQTFLCFFLGRVGQHHAVPVNIIILTAVVPDGISIFRVWESIGSHCDLKPFLRRLGFLFLCSFFNLRRHFMGGRLFLGIFYFFGLFLILTFPVPVRFSSQNLSKELFIL